MSNTNIQSTGIERGQSQQTLEESGRQPFASPFASVALTQSGVDALPSSERASLHTGAEQVDHFAKPLSSAAPPQALLDAAQRIAPSVAQDLTIIMRSIAPADQAQFTASMQIFLGRKDVSPEQLAAAVENMRTLIERLDRNAGRADVLALMKPRVSELLTSLAAELGVERNRHQAQWAICAESTNRANLIAARPEEYTRLWSNLATQGTTDWACKTETLELHIDAARMRSSGRPPMGLSAFVFDASQIQYANRGSYDPASDITTRPDGTTIIGTLKDGYQRLHNAAFNEASARIDTTVARGAESGQEQPVEPAELLDRMRRYTEEASGRRIMCEIRGVPGSPHAMHIVAFMGTDAHGNVIIKNPWHEQDGGGIQTIPRAEFLGKLCCAIVPVEGLAEGDPRRQRAVMEIDANPYMPQGEGGVLELHARPKREEQKISTSSGRSQRSTVEEWWKKPASAVEHQFAGGHYGAAAGRRKHNSENDGGTAE